jgi:hypothetical protein
MIFLPLPLAGEGWGEGEFCRMTVVGTSESQPLSLRILRVRFPSPAEGRGF